MQILSHTHAHTNDIWNRNDNSETYIKMVTIPHKESIQTIRYLGRRRWRTTSPGGHTNKDKLKRACDRIVCHKFDDISITPHNQEQLQNKLFGSYPCSPCPAGKVGLETFAVVSIIFIKFCKCIAINPNERMDDFTEVTDGMAPVR